MRKQKITDEVFNINTKLNKILNYFKATLDVERDSLKLAAKVEYDLGILKMKLEKHTCKHSEQKLVLNPEHTIVINNDKIYAEVRCISCGKLLKTFPTRKDYLLSQQKYYKDKLVNIGCQLKKEDE